jgi:DNA invertase Pin-like site-specific DNA recombinase
VNFKKKHIFFRRVSTAGQELTMQEAADLSYRDKLFDEQFIIIDEFAMSANKKAIAERPEMQKLITLIQKDKVQTLYAFDRTRLFRDYYEGMEFTDLCLKHGVQIIYTSEGNGHIKSTDDILLEGFLNMFSDIEGKNIARRTEESRRRYPSQKFGYIKNKELKTYQKDPNRKELIEQYFNSLEEISTLDDLCVVIKEFQNALKYTDKKLIALASDPFYAACDIKIAHNKLKHVEPYIELNSFLQLQENKGHLFKAYLKRIELLETQNIFNPYCGLCRKPMQYRKDKTSNKGYYTCARKHLKITINFIDLKQIVKQVLKEVITKLDSKQMIYNSYKILREIKKDFIKEIKAYEYQINEIMEELILDTEEYSGDWKNDLKYKKINQLKTERESLLEELNTKENLLHDNKKIGEMAKENMINGINNNLTFIYSMFVSNLYIYHNLIDVEVFMFNYLPEIQSELIYQGGEIA